MAAICTIRMVWRPETGLTSGNYVPGDPVRHLWKVYARTGRLVVRTPREGFSTSTAFAVSFNCPPDGWLRSGFVPGFYMRITWGRIGLLVWMDVKVPAQMYPLHDASASGNSGCNRRWSRTRGVCHSAERCIPYLYLPPRSLGNGWKRSVALASRLPIQVCMVGKAPYKGEALETVLYATRQPCRSDGSSECTPRYSGVRGCWCVHIDRSPNWWS